MSADPSQKEMGCAVQKCMPQQWWSQPTQATMTTAALRSS